MTSYESAMLLANTLDGKKGEEIKVLKTEGLTTLADYFVICTATSTTQIKAMSDACEEAMEKNGERVPPHRGPPGRHLAADGLLRGGGPHLHGRGPEVLRSGAPVGRRGGDSSGEASGGPVSRVLGEEKS